MLYLLVGFGMKYYAFPKASANLLIYANLTKVLLIFLYFAI